MANSKIGPIPDSHFENDLDFDIETALAKYSSAHVMTLGKLGLRMLTREADFNEADHPRDPDGKFADGGGGDGEADKGATGAGNSEQAVELHPEAIDVGGNEWNKETAVRLEKEYAQERKNVEAHVDKASGKTVNTEVSEDDFVSPPDSWDMLGSDQQEQALQAYKEKTYDDYLDQEVENWQSEHAADDAKTSVAEYFQDEDKNEWAVDALAELRASYKEDGKSDLPYSDAAILYALKIAHEPGYGSSSSKGTSIDFNTDQLEPDINQNQTKFEGMEDVPVPTALTKDQKSDIINTINDAFEKEAEKVASNMQPPEYLGEGVTEYQEESWSSMDDSEKFNWTESNTGIIEDAVSNAEESNGGASEQLDRLPEKFDPMGEHSQQDYKRTQLLARYVSVQRAAEIIVKRGLVTEDTPQEILQHVRSSDASIWGAWKGSSSSMEGKLLQLASSEELGGKLNTTHRDFDIDEIKRYANNAHGSIGGYEGVKAYVRAKWETTQYLLEKAGQNTVSVYRGVSIPEVSITDKIKLYTEGNEEHAHVFDKGKDVNDMKAILEASGKKVIVETIPSENAVKIEEVNVDPDILKENARIYERLPEIHVARNGAASTTTNPSIANGWGNSKDRVVLRLSVPRTAVLSVPAYGQNVHSEQEVVVTGTAWKAWDAWKGKAPAFSLVPLEKH